MPWRDDEGYPRVQYGGAYMPSTLDETTGPSYHYKLSTGSREEAEVPSYEKSMPARIGEEAMETPDDKSAVVVGKEAAGASYAWSADVGSRLGSSPMAGAAKGGVLTPAVHGHAAKNISSNSNSYSYSDSFNGSRRRNRHPAWDEPRTQYSRGSEGGAGDGRAKSRVHPATLSTSPLKGLDDAERINSDNNSSNIEVPQEQQDLFAAAAAAAVTAARAAAVAAAAVTAAEIAADDSATAAAKAAAAATASGPLSNQRNRRTGSATDHLNRIPAEKSTRERAPNGKLRQETPFQMAATTAEPPEAGFGAVLYSLAQVCGVVAAGGTVVALSVALVTAIRGGPKIGYVRLRE